MKNLAGLRKSEGLDIGQNANILLIFGMNGVAVDRHGLILGHDGATDSRKVSRCLPDLRKALTNSKMTRTADNRKMCFSRICSYIF